MKKYIVLAIGVLVCMILLLAPGAISQIKVQYNAEIVVSMDAPWSVTSANGEFPIVVYIKRVYPVTLKRITVTNLSSSKIAEYLPNITIDYPFYMYVIDKDINGNPLTYKSFGSYNLHDSVDIFVEVELADNVLAAGIYKKHLKVYVAEPLPSLDNWYPGDTHFHSDFTDNPLEWGAGLLKWNAYEGDAIVKRMGKAIGLKWVTITDHSCDFGDDDNGTPEAGEALQWINMKNLCLSENAIDDTFTIIPAEEVTTSIYGGLLGRLHLLAYDTHGYVDGPEIVRFSDHWAGNLTIFSDAIYDVNKRRGFCFAAHPISTIDNILGLPLGKWPNSACKTGLTIPSFKGLELWNTRKRKQKTVLRNPYSIDPFPWQELAKTGWHTELTAGIDQWDTLLCQHLNPFRKVIIEGGSDAHGDFNYTTSNVSLNPISWVTYALNDNAFGIVRTYIYSENGLAQEDIINSLKEGHSIVTDGPLVIFGIDNDGNSELGAGDVIPGDECSIPRNSQVKFLIKCVSNTQYRDIENGTVNKIVITWGDASGTSTTPYGNISNWITPVVLSSERYYYRVEARVTNPQGTIIYRAFTNPIWINWTDPVSVPALSWLRINNGYLSTANRIVTLNNACTRNPTKYRASENVDFIDAKWQSYSKAPRFTITSAGNGIKKIYFQTKNKLGESRAINDTITLIEKVPAITSFSINSGDLTTTSRTVTLNNTTSKYPLYYRASEKDDFSDAEWKDYLIAPSFDIGSSGGGEKTVYFQVKNGAGESVAKNDLISLDASGGMDWTEKFPSPNPGARAQHAMAYDEARGEVVLFGGVNGGLRDDTWVWDGTGWTLKTPLHKPVARAYHAMAYDAARGQVVLFGGADSSNMRRDDTWVWDGTDWTPKTPLHKPDARVAAAIAYDAARGQVVLFGGWNYHWDNLGDTWVWDGDDWTSMGPANKPSPRHWPAMAYDAARREVVLFGGDELSGIGDKDDTWVWDGTDWTPKTPLHKPDPRKLHAMAYDAVRGQVVLFGGLLVSSDHTTWVWDGDDWTSMDTTNIPSLRIYHAMAYDTAREQVVLFGGYNDLDKSDTWVWGPSSTSLSKKLKEAKK